MTQRLAIMFAACLTSITVYAQENEPRWYQVEIVVFLNRTAALATREDWSRDPGEPDLQDAVRLQPIPEAAAGLMPFQILAPEELELVEAVEKLKRSGHYEPLLHTGWRQPFAENQEVFTPVVIEAPLEQPSEASTAAMPPAPATVTTAPAAPIETIAAQSLAPAPVTTPLVLTGELPAPPKPGIEGNVRLRVARYLHLDVDLLYRKELPLPPEMAQTAPAATTGGNLLLSTNPTPQETSQASFISGLMADFMGLTKTYFQTYRMTEQRRMRRDELHYFDHPHFGVLAKVSAYELPAVESAPSLLVPSTTPLPVPVTAPGKATTKPLQ